MKIDAKIQEAIEQCLQKKGLSGNALASALGIGNSTVARWRNSRAGEIQNRHWVKLSPLLRPYMEPVPTLSPGEWLNAKAKAKKVSQAAIGRELGISQAGVSKALLDPDMSIERAKTIAKIIGLTPDEQEEFSKIAWGSYDSAIHPTPEPAQAASISRRDYYVCAVTQGALRNLDAVDSEEIVALAAAVVALADAVLAEADKTKKED